MYFSYWIYTKLFIWTAPYIKAISGQKKTLEPPKLCLYQGTKILLLRMHPYIYFAITDRSVINDKYVLSIAPKLVYTDPVGNLYSQFGTPDEHKNT